MNAGLTLAARFALVVGLLAAPAAVLADKGAPGLAEATPPRVERVGHRRVVVLGDSTAEFVGRAMMALPVDLTNVGLRRCPLRPDPHHGRVIKDGRVEDLSRVTDPASALNGHPCGWRDYLPGYRAAIRGATVVVYAAPMQAVNFDDGHLPDLDMRRALLGEVRALLRLLDTYGAAEVRLVAAPQSRAAADAPGGRYWLDRDRYTAWIGVLRLVNELRPITCLVDYAAYAATVPDPRPDGSHMEGEGAVDAARFILDSPCN